MTDRTPDATKVRVAEHEARKEKARGIYALDLHQTLQIAGKAWVLRVPGGWVYGGVDSDVFVPYNTEFKAPVSPPTP